MAFSGEAEVLTWQRVQAALTGGPGAGVGASPGAQNVFEFGIKSWMAQHKRAPQLQFVAFNRTTNGSDGGNATAVVCSGACTLIALYGKKYTGTTLSYLAISNHATAMQAQKEYLAAGTAAGIESVEFYPTGVAYGTGIVISAVTAYNGTTQSLIADSWDGFVIIAA